MKRWIISLLLAAASLSSGAQPSGPFLLTPEQVSQALVRQGIQVSAGHLTLLAQVVATTRNPALDILTTTRLAASSSRQTSETRSLVKVACREPSECLPFYAVGVFPTQSAEKSIRGTSPASMQASSTQLNLASERMRAGTHATLVMDDGRSHIKVAVVSLENGALGQTIRVASPDHKQTYTAEVVSANVVKGRF